MLWLVQVLKEMGVLQAPWSTTDISAPTDMQSSMETGERR
jgi:hypothetical protein